MNTKVKLACVSLGVGALVVTGAAVAYGGGASNPEAALGGAAVTHDAYEEAYGAFSACMADAGTPLAGERLVGVIREYSYLESATSEYEVCYEDFAPLDYAWQVANSYTSPTYVRLRECLREVGVEPGPDVESVWAQVQENAIDPDACTSGAES